jgi:hypothetical protein
MTQGEANRLRMFKEDVVNAAVFAEKAREKLSRAEDVYENEICKLKAEGSTKS